MLGIQECGDAPWAAPRPISRRGDDAFDAYVDPQDLLYADEDIDKVYTQRQSWPPNVAFCSGDRCDVP